MQYRIFAHQGQVTAIGFNREHINATGVEVASGDAEPEALAAKLAELAPSGVGSPWPPVAPVQPKKK